MSIRTILFVLVASMVAGCGEDNRRSFRLEVPETRTWPAAGVTQLVASTVSGSLSVSVAQLDTITAHITRSCTGKDRADAEANIDAVVVTDTIAGGKLTLDAEMPTSGERNYNANFDVSGPAFTHLDLEVANGVITVQEHRGSIEATMANGSITCDLALLDSGKSVALSTANGNVLLTLPSDTSASFDTSVANGTITISGFPQVDYATDQSTHKAGTIGSGGATITIQISNGNITIQVR